MNFGDPLSDRRRSGFIWKQLHPCPMSGCWIWTGKIDPKGYARTGVHTRLVHEAFGPHAPGLEVDHKCRVRCCCNPLHLEAVTHRVNLLRGNTFAARHAQATHCPKGHPYDEENTYRATRGHRICRTCHRQQESDRLRKQGEFLMANPGAKPTGISSPSAIVRHGFTRAQRTAVARRDARTMEALSQNYDRAVVDQICVLCDRFAAGKAA